MSVESLPRCASVRWSARRKRAKRALNRSGFAGWGTQLWVAALYLASYEGEALGEPANDVEAVEHMAGSW